MKFFKYLLLLICVLILGSCTPSYSSLQSINVINIPDSIEIGKFDDAGIKFELVYSDGTKQIENVTEKTIPEEHRHYLTEEGTHDFSFLYRGIEVEFSITMYELKYTITFVNAIDEVVKEVKFRPNSNLYPTNDEMYVEGYRFLGTYDNDLSNVNSDLTVKGNYVKVWTVEFYNGLGKLISSQLIDDGNSAASPTVDELNVDGYEFVMWDQAFDKVNSDLKIYGIYQKVHTHKYNEVVKEPTCEEQGFTTYTCSCGDTYIDSYVDALGHEFDKWTLITPNNCEEDGLEQRNCINCEHYETNVIKAHGHNIVIDEEIKPTCTATGLTQGEHCTKCDYLITPEIIPALGHLYENGLCVKCGQLDIIEDFEFELNEDNKSYSIVAYNGVRTEVIIPDQYNGLPVNTIKFLTSYNEYIEKLVIGDNISYIMEYSMLACPRLESIYISSSVLKIGYGAFTWLPALKEIVVDKDNEVYDSRENCNAIIESDTLLLGCINTIIPDSVKIIGAHAFEHNDSLTEITIPNSINRIETNAFWTCFSLSKIIYEGTKESFGNILIDEGNDEIYSCEIIYCNNHTHQFSDWIVIAEQTCEDEGYRYKECTICKEKLEEEFMPPLGHNYQNNECIDCGNKLSTEPIYIFNEDKTEVTFGSYPQSLITDEMIKSSLNDLIGELPTSSNSYNWIDYKYYIKGSNSTPFMWYQDINLNSELYRAVYFTSYRPSNTNNSSSLENSFQDENGYYVSTVYYFKYEPITWRILKLDTENNKAFLFANIALDSQDYNHIDTSNTINGETIYANNYEYSTIRKWLNDNFFNTAFNANEKSIILNIDVDNSASSTGYKTNKYECNNTLDKLFLLSYQDVINPDYSFDSVYSEKDENRQLKATDYASLQGSDQSSSLSNLENCSWWLRSPFPVLPNLSNMVSGVRDSGNIGLAANVSNTGNGIVPALWISIENEEYHIHTESDWIIESEPTCDLDGYMYIECVICGKILDEEIIEATGHNYNDKNICGTCGYRCEHVMEIKYLTTPTCVEDGYWECVCSLCGYSENEILEKTPHEYIDGICTFCKTKEFSSGLEYIERNGVYYLRGLGTCTDEHIIIPSVVDGYEVKGICESTFDFCDFVKIITISEGIEYLEASSIAFCYNLEIVNLPSTVTSILTHNFAFCDNLREINVDEDNPTHYFIDGVLYYQYETYKEIVKYLSTKTDRSFVVESDVVEVADFAFQWNCHLESIKFECIDTPYIGSYAFAVCHALKTVILPKGINSIAEYTFSNCSSLESIDLGDEISYIGNGAFEGCTSLKEIYIPASVTDMGCDDFSNVFSNTPNLIIRCEASQKPADWPDNWSEGSKEVIWGC